MKKILSVLLVVCIVGVLAACQPSNSPGTSPSSSPGSGTRVSDDLEKILEFIYKNADLDDQFNRFVKEGLQTTEITSENCEYFLGKPNIEYKEAIASEPIISPGAYELDLVRVKPGANIESIKATIRANINPQKWVCVGVSEEGIIVDSKGDLIIVIMSDNAAEELHEAFLMLEG